MFKAFHHVALICKDIEISKKFYMDILGFQLIAENYRPAKNSWKVDLRTGTMQLELFTFPNATLRPVMPLPESRGLRHLAFVCADLEATRKSLLANNVQCEEIKLDEYTDKKFFFFYDPDNQPLEAYSE